MRTLINTKMNLSRNNDADFILFYNVIQWYNNYNSTTKRQTMGNHGTQSYAPYGSDKAKAGELPNGFFVYIKSHNKEQKA